MLRVRYVAVTLGLVLSSLFGPLASPATFAAPAPTRAPAPAKAGITSTKQPGTVRRGATTSVAIKTAAKASCSITVRYKSGPSTAQGLVTKQADGSGVVSWAWKVGTRTTPGSWPVIISCKGQGTAQTAVRVP
jgi:micrococcal nuclease